MIEVSIYDRGTGSILRTGTFPNWDNVNANTHEGEGALLGAWAPERYRIKAGRPVELPPAPAPHMSWVLGSWVDMRTAEQRAADLDAARAAACLSRSALLLALLERRVVDAAEVAALAAGTFPPRIEMLMPAADENLRAVILVRWMQDQFCRLDPLIVAAGARMGVADATLDEIFGVLEAR